MCVSRKEFDIELLVFKENLRRNTMNETLKVLETRRSCRKFKPDMITEEELQAVIKAGSYGI